jgi:hypothetical protein
LSRSGARPVCTVYWMTGTMISRPLLFRAGCCQVSPVGEHLDRLLLQGDRDGAAKEAPDPCRCDRVGGYLLDLVVADGDGLAGKASEGERVGRDLP